MFIFSSYRCICNFGILFFPYYQFYADSNDNTPITELDINEEYTFYRLNNANSHPFYISDVVPGQESTNAITLSGSGNATSGLLAAKVLLFPLIALPLMINYITIVVPIYSCTES